MEGTDLRHREEGGMDPLPPAVAGGRLEEGLEDKTTGATAGVTGKLYLNMPSDIRSSYVCLFVSAILLVRIG